MVYTLCNALQSTAELILDDALATIYSPLHCKQIECSFSQNSQLQHHFVNMKSQYNLLIAFRTHNCMIFLSNVYLVSLFPVFQDPSFSSSTLAVFMCRYACRTLVYKCLVLFVRFHCVIDWILSRVNNQVVISEFA